MLDYLQAEVPAALRVVRDEPASYDATPTTKKREPFTVIPNSLLDNERISGNGVKLYAYLTRYIWEGKGQARVSLKDLAKRANLSRSHVEKLVDILVAEGYIARKGTGSRLPNIYSLDRTEVYDDPEEGSGKTAQRSTLDRTEVYTRPHRGLSTRRDPFNVKDKKIEDTSAPSEPVPPTLSTGPHKPRTPTLQSTVIDLIVAQGAPVTFTARDGKALKEASPDPVLVAEVYCAIYQRRWGDTFCVRNLSVAFAVSRLAGYQASKQDGFSVARATGTYGRPNYDGMTAGQIADEKAKTMPGHSGYNHAGMAVMPHQVFHNG